MMKARDVTLGSQLKKDITGKFFLKKDVSFASLVNAVLFDGEEVIELKDVKALDSEESSQIETREHDIISKERRRDIIKKVVIDGQEVILAIEIQQEEDKMMSLRVMGYDYLDYLNQVENGNEELLPIVTIVLYCGEKKWNKAKDIEEMMKSVPKAIKDYFKKYSLNLVDIKDIKTEYISDEETRVIIEAIQRLYKFKGVESLEGLSMTKKQLMIAGSLTSTDEVIRMAEEMEEGEKSVCSAFSEYVQKERKQGIAEGKAEGKAVGMIEGKHESKLEIAKKMIKAGKSALEEISYLTELDIECLKELQIA